MLEDALSAQTSPLDDVAQQAELVELRRSRDQLAAILEGIAEGVTVQDLDGRLIFANDVAAHLSGFSSAEEFRQSFPNFVQRFTLFDERGESFPYDRLPGRRLLRGEQPDEVVVQFRDLASGEWRWSILDAAPVLDERGHLQMVVNIFRDVDLIESDKQVRRVAVAHANPDAAELAQAIWRYQPADDVRVALQPRSWIVLPLVARGQTLGTMTLATAGSGRRYDEIDFEVARDLATRAALAIDSAFLYREAQEQAEHHAVLNAALRETVEERDRALADLQQALRTRDELLDLASMQMGRPLDLDRTPSDLIELARQVAEEQQLASERHTIRVDSREPRVVGSGMGGAWARVLANLLDNAVKYSPDGGPIDVYVHRDADWVVVDVIDQGIGIPDDDQRRIFDRFQRASNVEHRIGGTGIGGLASVRHILDSHGGTITVASREGSGTTFTVRLPIGVE